MLRIKTGILTNRPLEDDAQAIVNMTNMCKELHCLPRAGGLLDQDAFVVFLMESVLVWQQERAALDQKRGSSGT